MKVIIIILIVCSVSCNTPKSNTKGIEESSSKDLVMTRNDTSFYENYNSQGQLVYTYMKYKGKHVGEMYIYGDSKTLLSTYNFHTEVLVCLNNQGDTVYQMVEDKKALLETWQKGHN